MQQTQAILGEIQRKNTVYSEINEHFEENFNAVWPSATINQRFF